MPDFTPAPGPDFAAAIRAQLASLKLHPTREAEIAEEMTQHLEDRMHDLKSRGLSDADAQRAAFDELARGDLARALAGLDRHAIPPAVQLGATSRAHRVEQFAQDTRFALRNLVRQPAFSIVAILTLAIGIGANTAIFGVIRSVLLRPLPYAHAEQLVQVWSDHRALGRAQPEWLTPPDFEDWRSGNRTFSGMAAYQGWFPDITNPGDPESLSGISVSGNYFDMLGAKPAMGRLLTMADDNASTEPVVVLSDAVFRRRFGGDASIVGRPLTLSGKTWTVIGVLPPAFHAPFQVQPELYRALRRPPDSKCGRGCVVLRAIGRLKPGVSVAAAQSDLQRMAVQEAKDFPATNAKVGAWLIPLHEQITGDTKRPLFALSGAVAFVLLIGCVNLANLLLVRGAGRGRELGVRAALGAGNGRIVRQLLTENALVALCGGALGVFLGFAGSRALSTLVPMSTRAVQDVHMDGMVLLFAAGITMLSAALFGLLPALHGARSNLMSALRTSGREGGRHGNRLRNTLVVAQLSLAVVLLVGAGLLMRSFLAMQRIDMGYRTSGVLFMNIAFPATRFPSAERGVAVVEDFETRLRANPAIALAEVTDQPVLGGGDQDITAIPVGQAPRADLPPSIWYRAVSQGYLSSMHMRLTRGRMFGAEDRAGAAKVGIINEEAARRFFPGEDPIGHELATGNNPEDPRITIIGVVASARSDGPNQPYKTEIFLPFAQFPSRGLTMVIEPRRDAAAAINAFRQTLHDVDPLIPIATTKPIESLVDEAVAQARVYATLLGVFAAAALLLAVLGVYGVMAYAVSQRQREIGVRLALGAAPSGIRRMVLWQGGQLALIGVGVGTLAALGLGRALGSLLFEVSAFDAPTFGIASAVLGAMALLAAWLPARRAMRVDPLVAIRQE